MARWRWIDRKFTFDYPPEKYPDLMERWRGTPARLEARLSTLSTEEARRRVDEGWTILENVGHLIDLGYLAVTRLEQILRGEELLIAADMTNQKTQLANHNARPLASLLAEFRAERERGVERFEAIHEADWGRSGLHPRLQQPMRIVDILYFDSEHDDYHLGRIGALIHSNRKC